MHVSEWQVVLCVLPAVPTPVRGRFLPCETGALTREGGRLALPVVHAGHLGGLSCVFVHQVGDADGPLGPSSQVRMRRWGFLLVKVPPALRPPALWIVPVLTGPQPLAQAGAPVLSASVGLSAAWSSPQPSPTCLCW